MMKKGLIGGISAVALLVIVASLAWAQGGWGWGRGCGARWQSMSPDSRQKVADLHNKVRQGQWDLCAMQQSGADPAKIAAKQRDLTQLRERLQKTMLTTAPATCPRLGQPGTPGPGGWGCGMGRGMGCGMWGGTCPWAQPPASAPQAP